MIKHIALVEWVIDAFTQQYGQKFVYGESIKQVREWADRVIEGNGGCTNFKVTLWDVENESLLEIEKYTIELPGYRIKKEKVQE